MGKEILWRLASRQRTNVKVGGALAKGFEGEVRLRLLEAAASFLPTHPTAVVFQHPHIL